MVIVGMVETVSYTHLDEYKRQGHCFEIIEKIKKNMKNCCALDSKKCDPGIIPEFEEMLGVMHCQQGGIL